jgi:imidazolonepropionase-like amidohydrolase
MDLFIEGYTVARVAPHGGAPEGATVVDGHGLYVIPGLIDAHVHLCSGRAGVGRTDMPHDLQRRQLIERSDDFLAMTGLLNAMDAVQIGVTTVRDLGSRHNQAVRLRDALEEGLALGPRILAAGTALAMTGGHGTSGPYQNIEADGVDAVRRAARSQLKAGVDLLKLQASGGIAAFPGEDPRRTQYSVDELRAAVEEAHAVDRKVAAHTGSPESIDRCLRAGVDSIEHGYLMMREQAHELAQRGAWFGPTLQILRANIRSARSRGEHERAAAVEELFMRPQQRAFRWAVEAGVRMTACSDSLGLSVREELECMVELGMSPSDALVTATSNAAAACGLDGVAGHIGAGLSADLVALRRDPTADITALRDVAFVYARGRRVPRTDPS